MPEPSPPGPSTPEPDLPGLSAGWDALPVHATVAEALRALDDRRTHAVVQALLRREPGAEPDLADGLDLAPRSYLGPLVFPLASLRRCCGPEPGMPYPEPEDRWRRRVGALVALLRSGEEPPPLLYQPGADHLMDGNHRLEALLEVGRTRHPVLLVFDDPEDRAAWAGRALQP